MGAATRHKGLAWLAEKGTSAAMQATEEADKRAWTTLPAKFEVARLIVPPGTHDVIVKPERERRSVIKGVKVEKGKKTIVTWKTMP